MAHGAKWLRRVGARSWNEWVVSKFAEQDLDLIFIINGEFLLPESVRRLRQEVAPVFIFHSDNPLPGTDASRPEYLGSARECDAYFIWSRKVARQLRTQGVHPVHYLPFAWDPVIHPPLGLAHEESGATVLFVGGWDRERERLLSRVAKRFPLDIWGPDYWETRTSSGSPVRAAWQGRAVYGREAAQVIAKASITLNLVRRQNRPDGTNMRTFEVPGIGGFLLATSTSGAREIFAREDGAGAYFHDAESLMRKLEEYLAKPEERRRIAEKAHRVVRAGHRYTDRVQRIVRVYQSREFTA